MEAYRRNPQVVFGELHGEWLAIDAEAGYCYSLNETGGFIWGLLESPRSVDEICRCVCEEFDVDDTRCRRDVVYILEELEKSGLVTREDGGVGLDPAHERNAASSA